MLPWYLESNVTRTKAAPENVDFYVHV